MVAGLEVKIVILNEMVASLRKESVAVTFT
jgi:hypothetical protein